MANRYNDLVEAYYYDGSKTVVKFRAVSQYEYQIKYVNYTPWNTKDYSCKDLMPPGAATGTQRLFAYANAAISGYRFAKWYYNNHNNDIIMPHVPTVVWTTDEE